MTDTTRGAVAPQPAPGHRDWYAFEALRAMPRLLLMADTNPYSRTYGSFDRSFWHYRTMDFPCGMNQEFLLPLALVYKHAMPGNRFHGRERLRELALAGIDFAHRASYPDGTTDDYFPFERAMGALVFSLYAMTEACIELGEKNDRHLDLFARRGDWLLKHNETGKLANHQAFAALALYNVYTLTKDEKYRKGSDDFRDLTLSWGSPEGWFQEYEGADPGYHSCLVGFFAKLWQKSGDRKILEALKRAAEFAWHFQHPDGSYAGEYGSRNTFHFYPHGFEVLAPHSEKAAAIADSFLFRGAPMRTRHYNDDDRMAAHYVYDWIQAWRDYHTGQRPGPVNLPTATETRWFEQARMLVVRTPKVHFVANASKGGVYKAISPDGMIAGDTGLIGELKDGRVVVTHQVTNNEIAISDDHRRLKVSGVFQRRKQHLPTPFKQVLFRIFMLTAGRFNANLVRRVLQKILIVGKSPLQIGFSRTIEVHEGGLRVIDQVTAPQGTRFRRLSAGTDATSIYVANSNTFQESRLLPWYHVGAEQLAQLNQSGKLTIEREFTVDPMES